MSRLGGTSRQHPVRLNVAKVHVPLSAVLAAWADRRLGAGGWWLLRHPFTVAAALVALLAWRVTLRSGPLPVPAVVGASALVVLVWRQVHRSSFTRLIVWRVRGVWRAATVYRYLWQPAMVTTALAIRV